MFEFDEAINSLTDVPCSAGEWVQGIKESLRKGSAQCPDPVNPLLLPEVANKAADYRQSYPRVFITLPGSLRLFISKI